MGDFNKSSNRNIGPFPIATNFRTVYASVRLIRDVLSVKDKVPAVVSSAENPREKFVRICQCTRSSVYGGILHHHCAIR